MLKLEWRPAAITDLLLIIEYIADHNPTAAQTLKDQIETKAARLPENPRAYRKGRVEGTREMVVRPNYLLVYREGERAITVLRVLHAARKWP